MLHLELLESRCLLNAAPAAALLHSHNLTGDATPAETRGALADRSHGESAADHPAPDHGAGPHGNGNGPGLVHKVLAGNGEDTGAGHSAANDEGGPRGNGEGPEHKLPAEDGEDAGSTARGHRSTAPAEAGQMPSTTEGVASAPAGQSPAAPAEGASLPLQPAGDASARPEPSRDAREPTVGPGGGAVEPAAVREESGPQLALGPGAKEVLGVPATKLFLPGGFSFGTEAGRPFAPGGRTAADGGGDSGLAPNNPAEDSSRLPGPESGSGDPAPGTGWLADARPYALAVAGVFPADWSLEGAVGEFFDGLGQLGLSLPQRRSDLLYMLGMIAAATAVAVEVVREQLRPPAPASPGGAARPLPGYGPGHEP
jgi:hypothetical protein